jgi:hypothetical protein
LTERSRDFPLESASGSILSLAKARKGRVAFAGNQIGALRHLPAIHPVLGKPATEPSFRIPVALDAVVEPVPEMALLVDAPLVVADPPLEAV